MFFLGRVWRSKKVVIHEPEQLFIKGSSQISLFLGIDFAQKGCNQNASLSYGSINSEQSGGYTDVNVKFTSNFLFWHLFLSLHCFITSERCFVKVLVKEKAAMLELGVPWYTVVSYWVPSLSAQGKWQVSSQSFALKIYATEVQDCGCMLLKRDKFPVSKLALPKKKKKKAMQTTNRGIILSLEKDYSMSGVEGWGGGRLSNLCVALPDS